MPMANKNRIELEILFEPLGHCVQCDTDILSCDHDH